MKIPTINRAAGFSLVELMVASALGIVISMMMFELLRTQIRVLNVQDALAEVNERGKFVLEFMRHEIEMAGYSESYSTEIPPVIISNSDQYGRFDHLTIQRRMQVEGDRDCLGDRVPAGYSNHLYISEYRVMPTPGVADHFELQCRVMVQHRDTGARLLTKTTALVNGVEAFQVQFGVAQQASGSMAPSSYLTTEEINLTDHEIVSLRLGLLLHNTNDYPLIQAELSGEVLRVLDYVIDSEVEIDLSDGRVRRVFETTIDLRNTRKRYVVR